MKKNTAQISYFSNADNISVPSMFKKIRSRIAFPVLTLISREQSLAMGLTPIDDERVIMALKHTKGKVLDVGCGANNFVKSYGDGVGVDVADWKGCDVVIKDASQLPFDTASFDTVSFLACLNHIPNREDEIGRAHV